MKQNKEGGKMYVLGITGGIGSGKSAALSYLQEKDDVYICDADKVAHLLQKKGETCYNQLVTNFGIEILDEFNEIDRRKLGAIVFEDKMKLEELNQIVHPQIRKMIELLIKKESNDGTKIFVIEAALLLESDFDNMCDEVWHMKCDKNIRLHRISESRNISKERFESIICKQLSEEEFERRCDVSIQNNGTLYQLNTELNQHYNRILKSIK